MKKYQINKPNEVKLVIGNSCGSCIHTNKPKKPREHVAHYEITKTERWCFKHQCHVTRETTCKDHESVNRAAKTAFTRIKKYNIRVQEIREVAILMGEQLVAFDNKTFRESCGWIVSRFDWDDGFGCEFKFNSKDNNTDRYLKRIRKELEK